MEIKRGQSHPGGVTADQHHAASHVFDSHSNVDAITETRGMVARVASGGSNWEGLALGADHRFLGSDGSDAVYRNIGWDAILSSSSGTDIQDAYDAGAGSILLLDGTHTLTGNITPPAGAMLWGQSLLNTKLEFGDADRRIIMSSAALLIGNMTVDGSTTTSGVLDCSQSLTKLERLRIQDCTTGINNNGGNVFAVDILLQVPKGTDDWLVANGGTLTLVNILTTSSTNTSLQVLGGTVFLSASNLVSGAVTTIAISSGDVFVTGGRYDCGSGGGVTVALTDQGSLHSVAAEYVGPADDLTNCIQISGNTGRSSITGGIIRNGLACLKLSNDRARITGVEIKDGKDGVIVTNGSDRNILTGNDINNNSQYGIHVQSGANNTIIQGNVVLDNTTDQIFDEGTDTRKGLNNTV